MAGLRDKAVAYLRVSGKGQIDGHGFDRQRDNILDYAKRNGVEVVGWFEEAYTGTKADRPVFAEMLAEVLNNGVRIIIVESMDRFARDLGVQIALLAKLRSEGIALISATTGEDVTASLDEDPMKEAMVLIQGVFAQAEKKRLVLKVSVRRTALGQPGGPLSSAPVNISRWF
ncbi:recombinase family protein [Planctomycetota bacterium]